MLESHVLIFMNISCHSKHVSFFPLVFSWKETVPSRTCRPDLPICPSKRTSSTSFCNKFGRWRADFAGQPDSVSFGSSKKNKKFPLVPIFWRNVTCIRIVTFVQRFFAFTDYNEDYSCLGLSFTDFRSLFDGMPIFIPKSFFLKQEITQKHLWGLNVKNFRKPPKTFSEKKPNKILWGFKPGRLRSPVCPKPSRRCWSPSCTRRCPWWRRWTSIHVYWVTKHRRWMRRKKQCFVCGQIWDVMLIWLKKTRFRIRWDVFRIRWDVFFQSVAYYRMHFFRITFLLRSSCWTTRAWETGWFLGDVGQPWNHQVCFGFSRPKILKKWNHTTWSSPKKRILKASDFSSGSEAALLLA